MKINFKSSNFIITLISIIVIIMAVIIFFIYKSNIEFNNRVISLNSINIIKDSPVTRIAILGGNSKHFEINKSEDIKEILNIIQGMQIKYSPDFINNSLSEDDHNFTCKVTVYTTWDEPILEITVLDSNTIKYNNYYYTVSEGTFDLEGLENIANNI